MRLCDYAGPVYLLIVANRLLLVAYSRSAQTAGLRSVLSRMKGNFHVRFRGWSDSNVTPLSLTRRFYTNFIY